MAEQIEANYEDLEGIANVFDQQLQRVEQLLQTVRGGMGQLESGGWIGVGADKFYAEMNELLLPAVQRLIQALEHASQATKQVAATFEGAEDEAGGLFRV